MKSTILGLSLVSAAAAQISVNGVSMVPAMTAYNNYASATAAASSSAPASYATAAPSSSDFYSVMPYSSYSSGGYKSLACGYGYSKQSDGSCQAESWVCSRSECFFLQDVEIDILF